MPQVSYHVPQRPMASLSLQSALIRTGPAPRPPESRKICGPLSGEWVPRVLPLSRGVAPAMLSQITCTRTEGGLVIAAVPSGQLTSQAQAGL